MATATRRGRKPATTKKPVTTKKAETKRKVDEIFKNLPILKGTATKKEMVKPQPINTDNNWLLEQSKELEQRVDELEGELIQYKESYEKLLQQKGGNVNEDWKPKMQAMFREMVSVRNRQGLKANIILDYSGTGPQGLLQQLQAIFPFLK